MLRAGAAKQRALDALTERLTQLEQQAASLFPSVASVPPGLAAAPAPKKASKKDGELPSQEEGFRISSLLSFWASLSATTKATLTTTMIIFTATFLLMLKLHIIQPVINQLTCYVYVFVVFGTVTAVIISDLTSQALKTFKDQLQPLHKLREQLHRIQNRLLLGGEDALCCSSLQESLQEHLHLGEDHFCRDDSSVESDLLQRARAELQQELGAKTDVDMKEELQVPLLLNIYNTYSEYLTRCPQAVLQATAAKLEGLLQHLRSSCGSQELVHVCRATTPFMFDVFIYYLLLKYGLVDLYSSNGNVTANYIFRGWPIEQQERRIWFLFGALWRVIWPERDYCACVEAYDYYTTMHSLFENSLHIGRGDLHRRLLRKGTEIRRMVEAAEHCEEWLEKDFQRIFSSYAKHSACLPGALMENIVCLQRWLLAGKVVGSLNTAEMMVKLLTLSDTCLDDTHWPFTKADVQYNFARLVSNWREGNIGSTARLYGKAKTSLGVRAPRDVLLILLFDAYEFREDDQQANLTEETAELHQALQKQHFEQWVVRHAPLLQLLTSSPPVLLHTLRRRCFQLLLWGHSEMRADRCHGRKVLERSYQLQVPQTTRCGVSPHHSASFCTCISKVARVGFTTFKAWRTLDDLEQRPLLQQAAFFRSADVLVGAVGAALGWMLLMLPGSQVLEWIPRGVQPCLYRCSEEWNADHLGMFGGLGRLSGVDHVCLRSEAHPLQLSDAKRFSATRATARDAYWRLENLQVDLHKFSRWVTEGTKRMKLVLTEKKEDPLHAIMAPRLDCHRIGCNHNKAVAQFCSSGLQDPDPKRLRTAEPEGVNFEALRRIGYGAQAEAEEAANAAASLQGTFSALQQKAQEDAAGRFKADIAFGRHD
eukprot:g9365.t1